MRDPTRVYVQPADATGTPLPGAPPVALPRFRVTERRLRIVAKQMASGEITPEPWGWLAGSWIEGLAAGIAEGMTGAEAEARMDAAIRQGIHEGNRRRR